MKQNNKTCKVCGKVYTFCNRCEEFDHLPRWMSMFCCQDCRDIFMTLTDYNMGKITEKEATSIINRCNTNFINDENGNKYIADKVKKIICNDEKNEIKIEEDFMNKPIIEESVINEEILKEENVKEVSEDVVSKPKRMKYSKRK